jgi:hypothetical protein
MRARPSLVGLTFGLLSVWMPNGPAATITLFPVADTTLIEAVPDNNMGAQPFVNVGTTQNRTRNRGLFRFDVASQIPAGAQITHAALVLAVTHQPSSGYAYSLFQWHRVLRPWGEGQEISTDQGSPGLGSRASPNAATWRDRFAATTNSWSAPGGAAPLDFDAVSGTDEMIYDMGSSPYTFPSTTQLIADVQSWIDYPETNFGWMLMAQDEAVPFTARRFGAREDPANAPQLLLDYQVPPRFEQVLVQGTNLVLRFRLEAEAGGELQTLDALSSRTWQSMAQLGASSASTNITMIVPLRPGARFFRLAVPN